MNPLNQTEEKREAVPNGVSRVGIAALGVLLQVLWIVWAALKLTRYYAWVQLAISVLTLGLYVGGQALLAFLLALRIYGRHTNSATKLSWIIVILTFPIFGVCLYLLFGRSGAVNIMRGRFTRTDTELQPHYATPLDRAAMPQDPALQNQIHYLQTQAHYPACRNTDVTKPSTLFLWSTTPSRIPSPGRALRIFWPSGPPPGWRCAFFTTTWAASGLWTPPLPKSCSSGASSAGYSTPSCRC